MTHLFSSPCRRLALLLSGAWLCVACSSASADAQEQPPKQASFNCERATLLDERLICSDILLSQADLELGRVYRALLDATTDPAVIEELHSDQHAWILRRNAECGVFKSTAPKESEWPAYVDCFLDAYGERAADLHRMAAEPAKPPSAIATPIRKSLMGVDPEEAPAQRRYLAATGIAVPTDIFRPPLRWIDQDRLVAVEGATQEPDGTRSLVVWSARTGTMVRTGVGVPVQWRRAICAAEDSVYLSGLPDAASTAVRRFTIDAGGRAIGNPPAEAQRGGCAVEIPALIDGRVIAADPTAATSLYLGSTNRGRAAGALRYVTEQQVARPPAPVVPLIRINSRFGLGGTYLPFLKRFLVWYEPARLPRSQWQAVQRRWAKADCLAYWLIDPETGRADTRCIPFGGYNEVRPIPVVAKAGAFLLVAPTAAQRVDDGWFGFYAVPDGHAQRIAPGAFTSAAVSPDGCRISLVDAASKVSVFDACAAFP